MLFLMQTLESESSSGELDQNLIDGLLKKIASKDKAALAELYDLIADPVYGFALSILKNSHEAEDVLHDTFLSVWGSVEKYSASGKPMAWIFTIARNHCLMRLRKDKTADIPEEDWENALSEKGVALEDRLVLESCMKALSDEEREIVLLHALGGLKHKEIAAMYNMPIATVLSKYNRSLEKLRKMIEGE